MLVRGYMGELHKLTVRPVAVKPTIVTASVYSVLYTRHGPSHTVSSAINFVQKKL